ncbi:MAG TPA: DUF2330 domain-containing protein [Polyangiaceae bacterium]|nr:DUF2330 domain-containing protein [Polyangiaceae bacterium]
MAASVVGTTTRAQACGGFFCSQVNPVNQAAERILFADNGDGTQTAVIEILYQGPSQHFSWLLPISSVPTSDQIKVASETALQRLQLATDPQYTMTTTIEGTCKPGDDTVGAPGALAGEGGEGGAASEGGGNGVHVEASGVVGSFDWAVISLDTTVSDPASAAVSWLGDNGYDVPQGAPDLLGPYLADGLYLLALKLTKGADTGSIRPIVLTYSGTQASIPIKLTAVSANDNMGVLTWLLGESRAVPQNYLSLELNEARINWFNPSSNYDDVVSAAADDAGGQGFVTELASSTDSLAHAVWTPYDDANWSIVNGYEYSSFTELMDTTTGYLSAYDGFWDAVKAVVTLPDGLTWDEFESCPGCYADQVENPPTSAELLDKLKEVVIDPFQYVQTLVSSHPHVTRLYTTMSADEMTLDPLFTFNPDLPDESNVHQATRVIECNPDVFQSDAPWRIELPQGGVVRGYASDVGTWPADFSNQPPNRIIAREGTSGQGKTIEDNTDAINAALDAYNATRPPLAATGGNGAGGTSTSGGSGPSSGAKGGGAKGGTTLGGGKGGTNAANGGGGEETAGEPAASGTGGTTGAGGRASPTPPALAAPSSQHGTGCSVAPGGGSDRTWASLCGLFLLGVRRRRRA